MHWVDCTYNAYNRYLVKDIASLSVSVIYIWLQFNHCKAIRDKAGVCQQKISQVTRLSRELADKTVKPCRSFEVLFCWTGCETNTRFVA